MCGITLAVVAILLALSQIAVNVSKWHTRKVEEDLNTPQVGIYKILSFAIKGELTFVTVSGAGYRHNQDAVWHFLPWEISGCTDCADTIRIEIDHYPPRETSYKTPYKATLEKHHS